MGDTAEPAATAARTTSGGGSGGGSEAGRVLGELLGSCVMCVPACLRTAPAFPARVLSGCALCILTRPFVARARRRGVVLELKLEVRSGATAGCVQAQSAH